MQRETGQHNKDSGWTEREHCKRQACLQRGDHSWRGQLEIIRAVPTATQRQEVILDKKGMLFKIKQETKTKIRTSRQSWRLIGACNRYNLKDFSTTRLLFEEKCLNPWRHFHSLLNLVLSLALCISSSTWLIMLAAVNRTYPLIKPKNKRCTEDIV